MAVSPSLNEGRSEVTGVSHPNRFASTSFASISVVSALVLDATMNSVLASGFSGLPSARTPNPSAKTTLPFWTMPTATPGIPSSCMACSVNVESLARRAASRVATFLPANDSRVKPLGKSRSKTSCTAARRFSPVASLMS